MYTKLVNSRTKNIHSKMLKYIIGLCIISLCDSADSTGNAYNSLILVQYFPITAFFVTQVSYRIANTSSIEFAEYIRDHWSMLETQKWVIHGLYAFNELNEHMIHCANSSGLSPRYNHNHLAESLKEELRSKWPALIVNRTEEGIWEMQYHMHGSCVAENQTHYFTKALELYGRHDMESVLRSSLIIPGNIYGFHRIHDVITDYLGVRVFINCLRARNTRAQYLLEIELCFDAEEVLVNCVHPPPVPLYLYTCDPNTPVIYPQVP